MILLKKTMVLYTFIHTMYQKMNGIKHKKYFQIMQHQMDTLVMLYPFLKTVLLLVNMVQIEHIFLN